MKEVSKKELIGTLLILSTAIISGFSVIANKFFVTSIDPLILTSLRALAIGIIFLVISLAIQKSTKQKTFKKVSWKYLLTIGIIGGGLAFWLFFSGLKLTLGTRAAFLHKTLPIYACILAFIFLKEKITKQQLTAVGIMLLGLIVMQATTLPREIRIGDILVLSATALWATENTIAKSAMMSKESPFVVTFSRMFFGSLILFAIIFLTGKTSLLLSLTAEQILYITISGLFLLGYVLTWYWGLKYINLSKASIILLLAPVVSLFAGILWLKEAPTTIQLVGSAIILFGAYLIILTKSEKRN